MSEEEAPAAPLPSWTSHLAVLSSPQGYDTAALLKELAGDAFPAITVLDAAALAAAAEGAKDSEAGTAIKAFKAQHAGAPLPGTLLAPLIASKLEELKAAGLVARDAAAAAAAAAAEAHAAAVAAAKEASEEPPPAPPPAPAPGPADVYCVLTGFGSGPADYAGLAPLGLGIDSAVWLAVTSGALREAAGGTYEPPPPAEGQEEPGVAEAPNTEARRDAAAEAIASLAGAHGSGLKHCACVSLAIERPPPPADGEEPAAAGWGVPAAVAAKVAELLSAMAAKRAMYDAYIGACFVVDVPVAPAALPDTRVYASLANTSPLHAQGVPFLLDCLLSQVVHSASTDEQAASYLVEQEISTISDYLSSQLAALSGPTKSAAQVAADEAAQSAERPRLVPAADESLARALCSSPYAVAQPSAAKALEREKALLSGLPVPGKGRNGIPAEPALSADERGVERTELHHFSKFSPAQVDGSMQLRALAALVNGADAHRAGQPQPPPSKAAGWLLADRPWSDELDASELCQRLVALRAAAAHPEMLTAYHARDDALLLAFHLPVPESRQAVDSRRLAMYNKTYRPFGAWHEWLMRGLPAWRVPAPPVPPLDGCLYRFAPSFDMARVEALTTTTSLFPTDHTVIRFNPTADGNRLTLSYHDGVHGALTRPPPVFDPDSDEPPAAPAASLALSLAGGTRVLAGACDGGFGVRVGGVDGLELQMDCTGVAHLTPPPPADEPAPVEPPSTAALLKLSRISASGVPTKADAGSGTDPYIKVTLLEHDEDDITVQTTPLMNGAEDGHSAWDDVLFLTLPDSAPRPPLIRLELFDKDFNKPDDLLATGELRIPTALGGQLAEVELLLPKGQKVLVSLTYSVVLGDPTSEVVPAKPAPLPYEVGRRVLPSGTVVRRLSDGALQALYRNANVSMLTPSGDTAGCWVHTNAAGLRVGVRPTGQEFYLPPLALASSTDPVTGCIVTTRSDGILVLTRADGSRLVTFACGTSLAMTADAEKYAGRGEVSVSAPGYPTVRLNLRQRSVLLATPDGAALSSADGTVRLSHPSGVSLQLAQSGLVELLPAALSTLEEVPNTGAGIHYISLPDGSFRLKDAEGSSFAVDLGGRVEVDIVMKDELAGAGADDDAPQPIGGGDEPEWSHPPRLFVCRPDGSGVELLRDADVALFEACRKGDASCSVVQEPLPSDPEAVSHCYTWRPWQLMEALRRQADDDESEAKALIGFMPRVEERPPVAPVLFFRRLVRREPLGVADRCTLERELREMEEWRLQEEQRAKALHVRDTRSAEVIAAEADIQRQLLQNKVHPQHQPVDIGQTLVAAQAKAAQDFLHAEAGKRRAAQEALEAAAAKAVAAEAARLAAIDASKHRKPADAPSLNGAYASRLVKPTPYGGAALDWGTSETLEHVTAAAATAAIAAAARAAAAAAAPPLAPELPAVETPPRHPEPPPPPDETLREDAGATGGTGADRAVDSPVGAWGQWGHDAAAEPSPGFSVATRGRGAEQMASSHPNMRNLLVEVPYKRGVRTLSINQRLLSQETNPSPTFQPAFELMPASAPFGTIRAGCIYRLRFKLVNVSAIPQRFNVRCQSAALRLVFRPGVAAPGMAVPFEVEVGCEEPAEIHEIVKVVTERESISLPVSASVLSDEAYETYLGSARVKSVPAGTAVPRLLSTSMRDPALLKSFALRPGDTDAGRLKGLAPTRIERDPLEGAAAESDED